MKVTVFQEISETWICAKDFQKPGSCNSGLAREKLSILLSPSKEDSFLFAESSCITRICTTPRITVLQGKSNSPEVSAGTKLFIYLSNLFTSEFFPWAIWDTWLRDTLEHKNYCNRLYLLSGLHIFPSKLKKKNKIHLLDCKNLKCHLKMTGDCSLWIFGFWMGCCYCCLE